MIDVLDIKNKIVDYIRENGISIPVRISKAVSLEPVFVAAILSEMVSSKMLKITNFRLGSSFFYYLDGQEKQIEQIGEKYFGGVEKEAFLLLKKNNILKDIEQKPAIRVALRNIKDFAVPFNKDNELFWKYVFFEEKEESILVNIEENKKEVIENLEETRNLDKMNDLENIRDNKLDIFEKDSSEENNRKEDIKYYKIPFIEEVKSFLQKKGFEYFDLLEDNRNEIIGIILADTSFGKNKFLVVAKNKKMLNDNDLIFAKNKADSLKMPLLILSKDKLNKKASDYLNEFSNLIKFYKID